MIHRGLAEALESFHCPLGIQRSSCDIDVYRLFGVTQLGCSEN